VKGFLREPLVHFLLIGALLFGLYHRFSPDAGTGTGSTRIVLSLEELVQQAQLFQAQWRRPPTADEFHVMVENRIREEVLYREALSMGLDASDEIVRRRMAQKMQFLAEDVAESYEPTDDSLRAWFTRHADQFAEPKRLSFRHLYFSPDRRGAKAESDARNALTRVAGQPEATTRADGLSDRFMFQEYYRDQTQETLRREFGPTFADAADSLPVGSWQGPVPSGFGWHLVFVDASTPGQRAAFENVEKEVRTAWLEEQKVLASEKAYRAIRARYTVLVPAMPASLPSADAGALPPPPGSNP
jgi:peptidyl-prolyl cis-trans isomerase C